MFLKWVLTTVGFSLAGAANLAALNLAIKPIGLEPKPLENLLLTLAPQSLVNSSVSNSNNLERSTPLKEKVLKVLFLWLAGWVSIMDEKSGRIYTGRTRGGNDRKGGMWCWSFGTSTGGTTACLCKQNLAHFCPLWDFGRHSNHDLE